MKNEFMMAFQIDRMTVFEVKYYTLGNNKNPYFTTSAAQFNRPKSDFNTCGQCQESVLKGVSMQFYTKWDHKHLSDLTQEEYDEIIEDLEVLKDAYNFYEKDVDDNGNLYGDNISFYTLKSLSMEKAK